MLKDINIFEINFKKINFNFKKVKIYFIFKKLQPLRMYIYILSLLLNYFYIVNILSFNTKLKLSLNINFITY